MGAIVGNTRCCTEFRAVAAESVGACPECHEHGVSIRLRTVKALLTQDALARLAAGVHQLCESSVCPVVYYDDQGGVYHRKDLQVAVRHKEPFGGRTICYCFGETEGTLRTEFEEHGRSDAVDRVLAHIEAGRCACDVRNPRGMCCLEDLATAVERVGAAVQAKRRP
jgi:hypothetical protein